MHGSACTLTHAHTHTRTHIKLKEMGLRQGFGELVKVFTNCGRTEDGGKGVVGW